MGWAAAARLARRTGFGATGAEVDSVAAQGADAYVRSILAADPIADPGARSTPAPEFAPVAPVRHRAADPASAADKKARNRALHAQDRQLTAWWLRRMCAVHTPFGEKLTFVWHAHFATSQQKVRDAGWMAQQNARLRGLGRGDFRALAYAVLTDAATLKWLDGEKNTVEGPNENLSREFMEIFTLGHGDGYTETDVREAARALTGWKIRPDGSTAVQPALHDNGIKTILGRTGNLDAAGFCDAILARPASAPFVLGRLWALLVSDTPPSPAVLTRIVHSYGADRNLASALHVTLTDPAFTAAAGSFVIGPVEWMVGVLRALRVPLERDATVRKVASALQSLGQLPFYPPSVGGWPSGPVWLSTAAADLRFRAAATLLPLADLPALPVSTTARLEAVAHLLGIATWSDRTLAVLKGSATAVPNLLAAAVNTPEYLVH